MSLGEYLVGFVVFAAMLGGVAWGSLLLLRARFGHLRGAERVIAAGLLTTLGVLAVHVVPLALGVLGRLTVVLAALAWVVAARAVPTVGEETGPDEQPAPLAPSPRRARRLAGWALGLALLLFLLMVGDQLTQATDRTDALNFHLPGVGAWIQSGSLWQIDVYLPDVSPGHYPGNGDTILLATVLPWKSDFLAHLAMYPFLVLSGVAAYALAKELRAPRSAAVVTGCLLVATPAVARTALPGGLVDTVMVFGFAAGILFLLRHHRTGRTSDLVLAGLGLGVALGTKWYAVSSVPIVIAVWLVASLLAGRGHRRVLREAAQVSGLALLAGGIWFVRNLVESANPFFPVKLELLGVTIFDAPPDLAREVAGFSIADYLDDPAIWTSSILPQYRYALAAPAALAAIGIVAAAVHLIRTRRARSAEPLWGTAAAGSVCAVLLAVAYAVTPYSAGGLEGRPTFVAFDARYAVPAIVVALPVLAWLAGRYRRGPVIFGALGLFAVVHGLHQTRKGMNAVFPLVDVGHVVLVLILLLAAGAAVIPAIAPLQGRAERRALAGVAAAAVVIAAVGAFEMQRVYTNERYFGIDPVADAILRDEGGSRKVGLASSWSDAGLGAPLVAYGPRYENEVAFVGRRDRGVLRNYRDARSFRAALRRGRYDLLIVGRGHVPRSVVPEERWARSAGYRRVEQSPRLTLMVAPGVEMAREGTR